MFSSTVESIAPDPNEEYFDACHKDRLCHNLFKLLKRGECVDVTLVAGADQKRSVFMSKTRLPKRPKMLLKHGIFRIVFGFRVPVHGLVLSAVSPYFKALLNGQMQEAAADVVTIDGVTGDALGAIVEFCYIGRIGITAHNVNDLVAAASRLELGRVEKLCEKYYRETLSRQNCLGLWLLAEQYGLRELKKEAYATVVESFAQLTNGEEYLNLRKEGMQKLLADDELCVYCEEDAFEALTAWIRFDEDERAIHFAELVKLIRFNGLNAAVSLTSVTKFSNGIFFS